MPGGCAQLRIAVDAAHVAIGKRDERVFQISALEHVEGLLASRCHCRIKRAGVELGVCFTIDTNAMATMPALKSDAGKQYRPDAIGLDAVDVISSDLDDTVHDDVLFRSGAEERGHGWTRGEAIDRPERHAAAASHSIG